MTRTTNRRSTNCSEAPIRSRHPGSSQAGIVGGLLLGIGAALVQAAPAPITTDYAPGEILVTLPDMPAPIVDEGVRPEVLADQVQAFLEQARTNGDPRFLGYAQNLLANWPEDRMTDRLLVLRATLRQSLHQFGTARRDLEQVLAGPADRGTRLQALLTLANLEIVQGNYGIAAKHCNRLQALYPGLIAASCKAQVRSRRGQAEAAYEDLSKAMATGVHHPTAIAWAQGTLAELATQLGRPDIDQHWRRALEVAPGDLYLRGLYADWLLGQQNYRRALAVTKGYNDVDSLAVLRAIALTRLGAGEAEPLVARLEQRFAEARWRGTLLHQRDYARFLLDIGNDADAALQQAIANWQSQREPLDTRLLLRAAMAAGDQATLARTRSWLDQHGQRDASYPETRP